MSGGEKNLGRETPEITEADKLRFERLDFDAVRQDVDRFIGPHLHKAITRPFGISKVGITSDESGEWDFDQEYSETISWYAERISGDGIVEKLLVISPGYSAIDRYSQAINNYTSTQPPEVANYLLKTTAFEIYAAGLTVNAYFQTAMTEVDPQFPDSILRMNTILREMAGSTGLRQTISSSDFEIKGELLQTLDFALRNSHNTLRLNRFRLAAGLYFEEYKKAEWPLKEAIVGAMRAALQEEFNSLRLQDEGIFEKFQVHIPTPTDSMLVQELTDDRRLIEKFDAFNRAKADDVHLDLVGWSFPMDKHEVARTLSNFEN